MTQPPRARMSYADYLALEARTGVKHEYLEGEVVAMAGGSAVHAILVGEVYRRLANVLDRRPCQARSSEQKVIVAETGLATYPDGSVTCGPRLAHPDDAQALTNPTVLIEVLSPSTEGWDRGGPRRRQHFTELYRRIPSLRTYLLVNQGQARIERYQRGEGGAWTWTAYEAGEAVPLPDLDLALPVDEVYAAAREEMARAVEVEREEAVEVAEA